MPVYVTTEFLSTSPVVVFVFTCSLNDGTVADARADGEACEECDNQPDSSDEYDERLAATDDRNPAARAELHRDRQHRLHAKRMGNDWLPPHHFCSTNCKLCHRWGQRTYVATPTGRGEAAVGG